MPVFPKCSKNGCVWIASRAFFHKDQKENVDGSSYVLNNIIILFSRTNIDGTTANITQSFNIKYKNDSYFNKFFKAYSCKDIEEETKDIKFKNYAKYGELLADDISVNDYNFLISFNSFKGFSIENICKINDTLQKRTKEMVWPDWVVTKYNLNSNLYTYVIK